MRNNMDRIPSQAEKEYVIEVERKLDSFMKMDIRYAIRNYITTVH